MYQIEQIYDGWILSVEHHNSLCTTIIKDTRQEVVRRNTRYFKNVDDLLATLKKILYTEELSES